MDGQQVEHWAGETFNHAPRRPQISSSSCAGFPAPSEDFQGRKMPGQNQAKGSAISSKLRMLLQLHASMPKSCPKRAGKAHLAGGIKAAGPLPVWNRGRHPVPLPGDTAPPARFTIVPSSRHKSRCLKPDRAERRVIRMGKPLARFASRPGSFLEDAFCPRRLFDLARNRNPGTTFFQTDVLRNAGSFNRSKFAPSSVRLLIYT